MIVTYWCDRHKSCTAWWPPREPKLAGVLDSFTVPLHSPTGLCPPGMPAVLAMQGDCQWPFENGANFHQSHKPTIHCNWGNPNLFLDQPITKGQCQPIRVHVSYHTDSPTASRPGLLSSLVESGTASSPTGPTASFILYRHLTTRKMQSHLTVVWQTQGN